MQNVKQEQLRKSIVMETSEFREIAPKIFGTEVYVDITWDKVSISEYDPFEGDNKEMDMATISEQLARYFDVKSIVSLQIEKTEKEYIWISYEE